MPEITKQDALRWLEVQRDAINTEIAYAAPSDQKQYHENLKIINRLAELVRLDAGEMSAVEYARAHDEICDATNTACANHARSEVVSRKDGTANGEDRGGAEA